MFNTSFAKGWSVRRLTYLAMFIALSIVGANIKIPSIIGTPAFDSFPGFLAALIMGPVNGAIVAAIGHLLTALTVGFPLTIPVHLLIACGMAGIVALFAVISRRSLWVGLGTGIVLNGLVFPGLFVLIPGYGKAFFLSMVLPLLVASILNIILAELVFKKLGKVIPASYVQVEKGKDSEPVNHSRS